MGDTIETYEEAVSALGAYPGIRKICVKKKVYRELLLRTDATMMLNGHMYDITGESLGAGVWKVWLKAQHAGKVTG